MGHREWEFNGGPWEWWMGRGRQRGGRQGRWFGSGDMKYVILKLLREKPMHGYEVMKELEEQTHGCYKPSPGTVYPTLQWLEDEGLVKAEEVGGKKVYSVTDAGREFLSENKSTVDAIFDRVEETLDSFLDDPMPDVTRLVGKLVGQVYRTTWKIRGDSAKMETIADILSRATQEVKDLRS
jgi:DNA-binding PadR family transcriptional regulator